jgi:hypothetical protein
LLVALFEKQNWFEGLAERWLVAVSVFVILLNGSFALLSLLPMEAPLRKLVIPLHALLLLFGIFKLGPRATGMVLAKTGRTVREKTQDFGPFLTVVLFLFGVILILYTAIGFFTVPGSVDELDYHVPQAVGAFQEGRVRMFDFPPLWILHYPQGAANLWAWTMFFTGGDYLFRIVQVGFCLQLLLAVWLLARRSGADSKSALLAVLTIAAMPIFYRLTTTVGADLGYAAAIVLCIAFLAPGRQDKKGLQNDLAATTLGLSQAFLIKIPIVAILFVTVGLAYFFLKRINRGQRIDFLSQVLKLPLTWVLVAITFFSSSRYLHNFFKFENPFYPITLRIAGHDIFLGPLVVGNAAGGHSTFGSVATMNAFKRWHAVFADWFQPLNEDAFGGAGPIFIFVVGFLAIVTMLEGIRRRESWIIVLAVLVAFMFVIPGAYIPRYALAWLSVLAVLAALAYKVVTPKLPTLPAVVGTILLATTLIPLYNIFLTYSWVSQIAHPKPWYIDRGQSVPEKVDIGRDRAPSAAIIKAIRDNVKSGATLIASVRTHAALLWNRDYSNKIAYLPLALENKKNWQIWINTLSHQNPDWVLVSSNSGLVEYLQQDNAASYTLFYADSITGNAEVDKFNMTLFKRKN